MPTSHERRSLAYRLTITMARLTPASNMPLILSSVVMKGLASARSNPKHLLHRLASRSMTDLVEAVQDCTKCRLLMASTLVQFGGGAGQNFDAFSVKMLTSLTSGLSSNDITSHITSLVQVVAKVRHRGNNSSDNRDTAPSEKKRNVKLKGNHNSRVKKKSNKDALMVIEGDEEDEEDKEDEDQDDTGVDQADSDDAAACAAIEALGALLKNASLAQRGYAARLVVAILVRIACIGKGYIFDC